jgi:sugar porter (SP) family MFS transporter
MMTGMMSGVNGTPDYVERMGIGHKVPPTHEGGSWDVKITHPTKEGGIVAIYYLGTLVGGFLGGWIGDIVGRVNCVRAGCAWVIVGATLQTAAMNSDWMLCARVINGVGTGILNVVVPVWSAETSDYTVRGMAIAFEFFLNIFGVALAYWIEFGLSYVANGDSVVRWRFPIAFQLFPMLLLTLFINFMPESPRWLASKGRNEEALEVLQRLRDDSVQAEAEFHDIIQTTEEDKEMDTSYWRMLIFPQGKLHISRRVQLAIWLQIIQEWNGIASITVYQPTIFAQAGFDSNKSSWLSGLNNIFYTLSTLVAVFTTDRIGRRKLSYIGAVVQGISMFLIGGFTKAAMVNDNAKFGSAAASFVFIFTAAFGASWLTVPWTYQNEIFPVQVRAKGAAWGVIGWSIGNGWLMLLSPVMFDAIGERTLYIFGGINFGSIAMVYLFYPETANRTLEEINWLFSANTPWNWDAEKVYAEKAAQYANFTKATKTGAVVDKEKLDFSAQSDHKESATESDTNAYS